MEADFGVSKANVYCIVNSRGRIAVQALCVIWGRVVWLYKKAQCECAEIGANCISFDGVILHRFPYKYHSVCCG